MNINSIYEIENLDELETLLSKYNTAEITEQLFAEFLKYCEYKNVSDWNKAVRLCECLAITGWGGHEPVQAVRGTFFNGNPETDFYNKFRETRYVSAIWSKRKNGFTMENDRAFYLYSPNVPSKQSGKYPATECIEDIKLLSQRNRILCNPICFIRTIGNCYKNSKAVIESIENSLQANLDKNMTPEKYGRAINSIVFNLCFSFYDNGSCKTNYIIADEKLNLKQKDFYPALLKIYRRAEIEKNGYYLRNRYEYGNFRNGIFRVSIHFERELSDMENQEQKEKMAFHIEEALGVVIGKLKKKQLKYNFDLMQDDFLKIINEWKKEVIVL
jgi:hypothetical protein